MDTITNRGKQVAIVTATIDQLLSAGVSLNEALKSTATEGSASTNEWVVSDSNAAKVEAYLHAHGSEDAE